MVAQLYTGFHYVNFSDSATSNLYLRWTLFLTAILGSEVAALYFIFHLHKAGAHGTRNAGNQS
jgi:hypothetical protein